MSLYNVLLNVGFLFGFVGAIRAPELGFFLTFVSFVSVQGRKMSVPSATNLATKRSDIYNIK